MRARPSALASARASRQPTSRWRWPAGSADGGSHFPRFAEKLEKRLTKRASPLLGLTVLSDSAKPVVRDSAPKSWQSKSSGEITTKVGVDVAAFCSSSETSFRARSELSLKNAGAEACSTEPFSSVRWAARRAAGCADAGGVEDLRCDEFWTHHLFIT